MKNILPIGIALVIRIYQRIDVLGEGERIEK